MNPQYWRVAARARHRCEYCGAPQAVFNLPFEVEHIIPRASEGRDADQNLALACRACNAHKGAFTEALDPLSGAVTQLFNPRANRWQQHFDVDAETFVIRGITAIGRATVDRLRFNEAMQLAARNEWSRLGMFPPMA